MQQVYIILSTFLMVISLQAASRSVFFTGGQSNAKEVWAASIADGLRDEYGLDMVMVHVTHPGAPLYQWFLTEPNMHYSNDFFNASGTGVLETAISAITNAGDEAVFRGFFWFQGETDTGSYASMNIYSNRFMSMLSQLKQDLGMTNDIDFTIAVIDGHPDPYYDDPANTGGRTRADVDYLRTIQKNMSDGTDGVFSDTRGYERTDFWHLTAAELERLGGVMSATHIAKFGTGKPTGKTIEIYSDDGDGAIFNYNYFQTQDLICGYTSGDRDYNGVAFFELPYKIIDSDLALTAVINMGVLSNANIDVWGLGYVATPVMDYTWMLTADTDTRMLLNGDSPVKIADNIVTSGQSVAVGTVWHTDISQRAVLFNFIDGLYDNGAKAGDYAVIRINTDAELSSYAGIRWGGSHHTSPEQRAKLTVVLPPQPMVMIIR